MFGWIKRLFSKKEEEKKEPRPYLYVIVNGREQAVRPMGLSGVYLVCETLEQGMEVITPKMAVDEEQYWLHWEKLGGVGMGLQWEDDGAPFDPRKDA